MNNPDSSENPTGQLLIYQDGATRLQVRLDGQSVWLTQRLLADLYQVSVPTVNEHLANIYDEGELEPQATIRNFRIVQREGSRDVSRVIEHYNLDAILAIRYRVRSPRGTLFRQWATARLSELLVKGFTLFHLSASIRAICGKKSWRSWRFNPFVPTRASSRPTLCLCVPCGE